MELPNNEREKDTTIHFSLQNKISSARNETVASFTGPVQVEAIWSPSPKMGQ